MPRQARDGRGRRLAALLLDTIGAAYRSAPVLAEAPARHIVPLIVVGLPYGAVIIEGDVAFCPTCLVVLDGTGFRPPLMDALRRTPSQQTQNAGRLFVVGADTKKTYTSLALRRLPQPILAIRRLAVRPPAGTRRKYIWLADVVPRGADTRQFPSLMRGRQVLAVSPSIAVGSITCALAIRARVPA